MALIAEVLSDRGRGEGGLDAHQRRLIRGCDDHDGALERIAEVAFDELTHLASTLADERDHVDRGAARARDHAQQRGLADARAGEDAEALSAPAGHETVERAHAEPDTFGDARARECFGRGCDRGARDARRGRPAVVGNAEPIDDPSEQTIADSDAEGLAGRQHARARSDAVQLAERHQQRAPVAKADDLGWNWSPPTPIPIGADHADLADLGLQAGGLDDQPDQVANETVAACQIRFADRLRGPAQQRARGGRAHGACSSPLSSAKATSRARSSCVSMPASTSPSTVRTITLPTCTRWSGCMSHSSRPFA